MAWHTRSLIVECSHYECEKLATVRLYNSTNTALGDYCAKCGSARADLENRTDRDLLRLRQKAEEAR